MLDPLKIIIINGGSRVTPFPYFGLAKDNPDEKTCPD